MQLSEQTIDLVDHHLFDKQFPPPFNGVKPEGLRSKLTVSFGYLSSEYKFIKRPEYVADIYKPFCNMMSCIAST